MIFKGQTQSLFKAFMTVNKSTEKLPMCLKFPEELCYFDFHVFRLPGSYTGQLALEVNITVTDVLVRCGGCRLGIHLLLTPRLHYVHLVHS